MRMFKPTTANNLKMQFHGKRVLSRETASKIQYNEVQIVLTVMCEYM